MPAQPPPPMTGPASGKRAYRSFWVLVGVSVLAIGSLSSALAAHSSPLTGIRVAVSGLILIASLILTTRVMTALARARQHARKPL